ncbi:pilus (MSHA type) biogenesis protein MshL [Aestuariirhabdus litorea]|uniref:Pilus (MSHA type) biogenesis protein MshL n=1 Tax=Aestuariirhabdus litorea TaxID=2528527 RepID=A0A3P3VL48_9GAMM|nr:pilus (MSHA type) biogenesis protein MshL [Aestuariirhabdus litorea]RRJ83114.1 pilus (MSHA type) biogenesis protein MshL [Aestuariirhabdus litorea]RWW93270.1 pilus (MSHA type) biogenesis protein MshL [Endozoicomonadaceae bacterium GTF-13]
MSGRLRWGAFGVLMVLLAGCANLQNSAYTKQETERQMSEVRADSDAYVDTRLRPPEPPAEVRNALLPELDIPLGEAGDRFDIAVKNMPARDFFMGLMEGSQQNIVVSPLLEGEVSLMLSDVSLEQVLSAVRDTYGYDYRRNDYGYQVLPAQVQTRIYRLDYLNIKRAGSSTTSVSSGQVSNASNRNSENASNNNASNTISRDNRGDTINSAEIKTTSNTDLWSEMTAMVQMIIGDHPEHRVVTNPQAGVLVVRAGSQELRGVEAFLNVAEDSLQRQVLLEAKIIEVELNDGFRSGIEWNAVFTPGSKDISFGQGAVPFSNTDISRGGNGLGGVFSGVLDLGDFTAAIDLLETQGNVDVLSSPRISTVNNQKAVIKVGNDEFFVTDFSTTTSTTSAGSTTVPDVTLTPFFSGIALDVTPQIAEDQEVILHIHPSVSDVVDQNKTISVGDASVTLPLAFSTIRESDSIVRAESGQVVVIGGLMKTYEKTDVAKTPVLGDLPGIGYLFQQRQSSFVKSELVILLKPQVVEIGTFNRDLRRSNARVNKLLKF